VYGRLKYPDVFPATGELLVDAYDRLWVQEYQAPWVTVSRWTVLGKDGAAVANVVLPDRFRLVEVGVDYLLGSWRDEDDVEHVRAYRFK